MKRVYALVAAVAVMTMTGCGGDDAPGATRTDGATDGATAPDVTSPTDAVTSDGGTPVAGLPTTGEPGELEFTLATLEGEDLVGTDTLEPDGTPDAHFVLRGLGPPVEAFILTTCDENGHGSSQWDTVAADAPLPAGFQYASGEETDVLLALNFGALIQDEDGTFRGDALGTNLTALDFHVTDDGGLAAGDGFACLTIVRPGGELTTVATPL